MSFHEKGAIFSKCEIRYENLRSQDLKANNLRLIYLYQFHQHHEKLK